MAREVNSSKKSAAVDDWLAMMSAHETPTGMARLCREALVGKNVKLESDASDDWHNTQ